MIFKKADKDMDSLEDLEDLGMEDEVLQDGPMTAMQLTRKEKDLTLFNKWKSTGDKKTLGELVSNLSPVIYSEVQRQSGTLPTAALSGEAKKWALKAINTFNPDKGAALATHVTSYLAKTRRMNYKYSNAARLPENLHLKWHQYNQALTGLTEKFNRDPTEDEIAKELGWKKTHVVRLKNSLYSDLFESGQARASAFSEFNRDKIVLDEIKSRLTPVEQTILDKIKLVPASDLATELGMNINQFNYTKAKLTDKIVKIKEEMEETYGSNGR